MITSLYGAVRFFGVAIGPPVFGTLMETSTLLTFLIPAGLAFLAGGACFIFIKQKFVQGQNNAQGQEQDGAIDHPSWGEIVFDTITLRNTVGKLVLKPVQKPVQLKKVDKKDKIAQVEYAGAKKEKKTSGEFAGQKEN